MDTTKTSLETSPMTYQCIVCQMTTVSMSLLHRHQTYRHTPEELSLSTIGLQCSLINNVNATNSIVYDNSWLCDPTKQAEFYTVSASLLNDCNNNNNNGNVVPVDYVVEKQRFLKKEPAKNGNQQEMRDFHYNIDCNLEKTDKLVHKNCEKELDFTKKSLEEIKYTVKSPSFNTETNCFSKQPKEFLFIGKKVEHDKNSSGIKEIKSVAIDTEINSGAKYPEEAKQGVKSKDFEFTHIKEFKFIDENVGQTKECSEAVKQAVKSVTINTETNVFSKYPEEVKQAVNTLSIDTEANSVTKYPEEFQIIGREVIFTTKSSEEDFTSKSPKKEAKESKVIVKEVNSVFEIAEKETEELKMISTKNSSPKSSESFRIEAKESKLIGDFNAKRAEKIIKGKKSQVAMDLDSFDNCIEGLCNDLKNLKNKPQKRKRTPAINAAAKKGKTTRKPRESRKKAKTCHTLLDNNTIIKKTQEEVYEKEMYPSINCVERNFENEKTENSVKQSIVNDDFADRLEISESKANIREIEISPYDCTTTNSLQCNFKTEITDILPNENFIQNHLETYDTEVLVEEDFTDANPIEIKPVIGEGDIENIVNEEIHENSENIGAINFPTEFTFPWYPPDINDYSILVLDPEAHQLVWTSVAIVEEQEELHTDAMQETLFLPELTEADLLGSEICENTTISSVSRAKENHNTTCLQSTSKETTTMKKMKPHTNFVLRPRKTAAKKKHRRQ